MMSRNSLKMSMSFSWASISYLSSWNIMMPSFGINEVVPGIPEKSTLIPYHDFRSDIC